MTRSVRSHLCWVRRAPKVSDMSDTGESKTVLVTGAGRNIGRNVAEMFARNGARVALNARGSDDIDKVTSGIRECGGEAMAVAGDVSSEVDVQRMVGLVAESYGPVDVLVHCATCRVKRSLVDMTLEEWHAPLRVGLDGGFLTARAVIPGMLAAGWGRIIMMTGLRGFTGIAKGAGPVTTKAGMGGLVKALALELATTGVTVNAVSPGRIETERREGATLGDVGSARASDKLRANGIPVGRMGRVDEISAACRYLASEEAAYVTGQTIHVNGGIFMP
jgi:3-oxoacyl-[acyl-carrier protein] reductase